MKQYSICNGYTLEVHKNSFGDQILVIRHDHKDGHHFVWSEVNYEGSHIDITIDYIFSLEKFCKCEEV